MSPAFQDITGYRFGDWTVLERLDHRNGSTHWLCRCRCGAEKEVSGQHLKRGKTKSCGCHREEQARERFTKHGLRGNVVYVTYGGIMDRCYNRNCAEYKWYGGRGITVCDRWRQHPKVFIEDMGPKPTPTHSIDRIDNDGNYEPGNCRWATRAQQRRNSSRLKLVTFRGKTQCLQDWADELGMSRDTLYSRLVRGNWDVERALETAVDETKRSRRAT